MKVGSPYTADVGEVLSIDMPEIIGDAVEATSHSSSGWREFVPGALAEVSEFTATINFTDTYVAALYADFAAGTKKSYQIQFPDDGATKWTFDAYITGLKPLGADAGSPETLQMEVKFQPTGANAVT